ncbi:MAG: hypothetical protein MJZ25_00370 [Fibrobacter sp.]|nr:hypothetical protein [Fibrobacter sp.]
MRKRLAVLLVLLFAGSAFAGERFLDKGIRFAAGYTSVVSDSKKDIFPSNSGFNATLSYDMTFRLIGGLHFHSAAAFDYRLFYEYFDSREVCGVTSEQNGHTHSVCKTEDAHGYNGFEMIYIQRPFLLQWRFPMGLFVEGGAILEMRFALKSEYEYEEDESEAYIPEFEDFGVALALGMGYKFKSGFSVDLRSAIQVTDIIGAKSLVDVEEKAFVKVDSEGHSYPVIMNVERPRGCYYKLFKIQLGVGYWF